ncbi:MAG: hypothetical protein HQ502_08380 [Alphaproteobacteria bacterium]|nr:hypothetical protein [Alphaproteobacteria bacterium]
MKQKGHERRTTARASDDWRIARGDDVLPNLNNLGIGDTALEWHDRFLIRIDRHMPHAVFIACGETLQSDWAMPRLGATLEDALPDNLRDSFAEGCQRSLEKGCPVPVEGSYCDQDLREILFRCVMMPVRAMNDGVNFIFGAYSHKVSA